MRGRKMRAMLLIGILVAALAAAILVTRSSNPDAGFANKNCNLGGRPALVLPRAPLKALKGAEEVQARVAGCLSTPQGELEIVVSQDKGTRCFFGDFPRMGSSLGGACASAQQDQRSACQVVCVVRVGSVGKPASTVVLGEVAPNGGELLVTGSFGGEHEVAVSGVVNPGGAMHLGVFAAVFRKCVSPNSIEVKYVAEGTGKSMAIRPEIIDPGLCSRG